MAHYAFLDENNAVTEVIVGVDETETLDGLAPEVWYGNFRNQKCVRTSYSSSIRKNYAGIGFYYDENLDAFIPPKPFASWILDEVTCHWAPPKSCPEDGNQYSWDEAAMDWVADNIDSDVNTVMYHDESEMFEV
jgi:hypothetical protein